MTTSVSPVFTDPLFQRYLAIWYTLLGPQCMPLIKDTVSRYRKPKFLPKLIYWYYRLGPPIITLMTKKVKSIFSNVLFQSFMEIWYNILDTNFIPFIIGTAPYLFREPDYLSLLIRVYREKGKGVLENRTRFRVADLNNMLQH